jgi:hypothetical protein
MRITDSFQGSAREKEAKLTLDSYTALNVSSRVAMYVVNLMLYKNASGH